LADKATPTAFPFGFASGHAFGSLSFGRSKESEQEVSPCFSKRQREERFLRRTHPRPFLRRGEVGS